MKKTLESRRKPKLRAGIGVGRLLGGFGMILRSAKRGYGGQECRVKGGRIISDNRKYFGNISEKQPFSEKISDLFFGDRLPRQARRADLSRQSRCGEGGSKPVKVSQTNTFGQEASNLYANYLL